MHKWKKRLYGYTGIFVVLGIWTPLLWFISAARAYYRMETFEFDRMHWPNIVLFFILVAATLFAQLGFVFIAQDVTELESKREHLQ